MSSAKQKILIIDDSQTNRVALEKCLSSEYDVIQAEDGTVAVPILKKFHASISLIFLDLDMPEMNGFGVLMYMKTNNFLKEMPVIVIGSEKDHKKISDAIKAGASDYITLPFDSSLVLKRTQNILSLFAKQKRLIKIVSDKFYERENNDNMLLDIIAHAVEFRNGENGHHIMNINIITDILLRRLVKRTDKYNLSNDDIDMIVDASALHDIGKVGIKESILNKPSKLTKEEFEIMKGHSKIGAKIIEDIDIYKNETIYKYALEIAKYHHERYDGSGYPNGLKGDSIPISAQVVGMADCYDVLINERVYKRTYTHEEAIRMILSGECGAFNPILLKCLKEAQHEIEEELNISSKVSRDQHKIQSIASSLFKGESDSYGLSNKTEISLDSERMKMLYTSKIFEELIFDYTKVTSVLNLNDSARELLKVDGVIYEPQNNKEFVEVFGRNNIDRFLNLLSYSSYKNSSFEMQFKILTNNKITKYTLVCSVMWDRFNHDEMIGFVGRAYRSR